jgi:membrane-bound metal-dependent hydrolase YbcI (DUF457 family)
MPITPFHFGPGAAIHALAPRHVSFLSFCAANVLIDVESLYNLLNDRYPVHAFLHTYLGATLAIAAVVLLFLAARRFADHFCLPDLFKWQELSLLQVFAGAVLGAYSHVLLDSVMHGDIEPLSPFDSANALLGAISLDTLHIACLALGVIGLLGVGVLRLVTRMRQNSN